MSGENYNAYGYGQYGAYAAYPAYPPAPNNAYPYAQQVAYPGAYGMSAYGAGAGTSHLAQPAAYAAPDDQDDLPVGSDAGSFAPDPAAPTHDTSFPGPALVDLTDEPQPSSAVAASQPAAQDPPSRKPPAKATKGSKGKAKAPAKPAPKAAPAPKAPSPPPAPPVAKAPSAPSPPPRGRRQPVVIPDSVSKDELENAVTAIHLRYAVGPSLECQAPGCEAVVESAKEAKVSKFAVRKHVFEHLDTRQFVCLLCPERNNHVFAITPHLKSKHGRKEKGGVELRETCRSEFRDLLDDPGLRLDFVSQLWNCWAPPPAAAAKPDPAPKAQPAPAAKAPAKEASRPTAHKPSAKAPAAKAAPKKANHSTAPAPPKAPSPPPAPKPAPVLVKKPSKAREDASSVVKAPVATKKAPAARSPSPPPMVQSKRGVAKQQPPPAKAASPQRPCKRTKAPSPVPEQPKRAVAKAAAPKAPSPLPPPKDLLTPKSLIAQTTKTATPPSKAKAPAKPAPPPKPAPVQRKTYGIKTTRGLDMANITLVSDGAHPEPLRLLRAIGGLLGMAEELGGSAPCHNPTCTKGAIELRQRPKLLDHISAHSDLPAFQCVHCEVRFRLVKPMQRHNCGKREFWDLRGQHEEDLLRLLSRSLPEQMRALGLFVQPKVNMDQTIDDSDVASSPEPSPSPKGKAAQLLLARVERKPSPKRQAASSAALKLTGRSASPLTRSPSTTARLRGSATSTPSPTATANRRPPVAKAPTPAPSITLPLAPEVAVTPVAGRRGKRMPSAARDSIADEELHSSPEAGPTPPPKKRPTLAELTSDARKTLEESTKKAAPATFSALRAKAPPAAASSPKTKQSQLPHKVKDEIKAKDSPKTKAAPVLKDSPKPKETPKAKETPKVQPAPKAKETPKPTVDLTKSPLTKAPAKRAAQSTPSPVVAAKTLTVPKVAESAVPAKVARKPSPKPSPKAVVKAPPATLPPQTVPVKVTVRKLATPPTTPKASAKTTANSAVNTTPQSLKAKAGPASPAPKSLVSTSSQTAWPVESTTQTAVTVARSPKRKTPKKPSCASQTGKWRIVLPASPPKEAPKRGLRQARLDEFLPPKAKASRLARPKDRKRRLRQASIRLFLGAKTPARPASPPGTPPIAELSLCSDDDDVATTAADSKRPKLINLTGAGVVDLVDLASPVKETSPKAVLPLLAAESEAARSSSVSLVVGNLVLAASMAPLALEAPKAAPPPQPESHEAEAAAVLRRLLLGVACSVSLPHVIALPHKALEEEAEDEEAEDEEAKAVLDNLILAATIVGQPNSAQPLGEASSEEDPEARAIVENLILAATIVGQPQRSPVPVVKKTLPAAPEEPERLEEPDTEARAFLYRLILAASISGQPEPVQKLAPETYFKPTAEPGPDYEARDFLFTLLERVEREAAVEELLSDALVSTTTGEDVVDELVEATSRIVARPLCQAPPSSPDPEVESERPLEADRAQPSAAVGFALFAAGFLQRLRRLLEESLLQAQPSQGFPTEPQSSAQTLPEAFELIESLVSRTEAGENKPSPAEPQASSSLMETACEASAEAEVELEIFPDHVCPETASFLESVLERLEWLAASEEEPRPRWTNQPSCSTPQAPLDETLPLMEADEEPRDPAAAKLLWELLLAVEAAEDDPPAQLLPAQPSETPLAPAPSQSSLKLLCLGESEASWLGLEAEAPEEAAELPTSPEPAKATPPTEATAPETETAMEEAEEDESWLLGPGADGALEGGLDGSLSEAEILGVEDVEAAVAAFDLDDSDGALPSPDVESQLLEDPPKAALDTTLPPSWAPEKEAATCPEAGQLLGSLLERVEEEAAAEAEGRAALLRWIRDQSRYSQGFWRPAAVAAKDSDHRHEAALFIDSLFDRLH